MRSEALFQRLSPMGAPPSRRRSSINHTDVLPRSEEEPRKTTGLDNPSARR